MSAGTEIDLEMRIQAVCAGQSFIVQTVQRQGTCAANVVFEHHGGITQIARIRVPEPLTEYIDAGEIELLLTYRALRAAKTFRRDVGNAPS